MSLTEDLRYTLAPYVSFGVAGETYYLGAGTEQIAITNPDIAKASQYIYTWAEQNGMGFTASELRKAMEEASLRYSVPMSDVSNLFSRDHLYLKAEIDRSGRYDRPGLYYNYCGADPELTQRRISNSHVCILGAGGIGILVSAGLAGSGIGKLTIIDSDTIEESNLTRQIMFRESDIGQKKCITLASEIEQLNSSVYTVAVDRNIECPEDLNSVIPQCDLIVLSADTPTDLVLWMDEFSFSSRIPFIQVGYISDIPTVGPLIDPSGGSLGWRKSPQFVASEASTDVNEKSSLVRTRQAPSHAWTNFVASGIAIDEVLSYLGGYQKAISSDKRIGFYKPSLEFGIQSFRTC